MGTIRQKSFEYVFFSSGLSTLMRRFGPLSCPCLITCPISQLFLRPWSAQTSPTDSKGPLLAEDEIAQTFAHREWIPALDPQGLLHARTPNVSSSANSLGETRGLYETQQRVR